MPGYIPTLIAIYTFFTHRLGFFTFFLYASEYALFVAERLRKRPP